MRILFALLLFVLATPTLADQYSCETVDKSAVAYVNTNVPVSKLETGRRCSLSVDGATRTGRRADAFVNGFNGLTDTLFFNDDGSQLPADMLVNVIAGPFIGGDGAGDSPIDEELAAAMTDAVGGQEVKILDACFRAFAQSVGPEFSFDTLQPFEPIEGARAACELVPAKEGSNPRGASIASFGALHIVFTLDERSLSLYVPAEFFRQARDGDGIFN